MNADGEKRFPHEALTGQIIAAAFDVSNALGCGFLEKVYENALTVELRHRGLSTTRQVPIRVVYRDETVGDYVADLIVERTVLVEIKATEDHKPVYTAQTLNYLRATRLPVALLINFGRPRLWYKRYVFSGGAAREATSPQRRGPGGAK